MKKKSLILFFICALCHFSPAMPGFQASLDSLNRRYTKVSGREKLETLLELSKIYWDVDPKKGIELGTQALALAQNLEYDKEIVKAMYYLGTVYYLDNQYDNSLDYSLQAYRFAKKHNFIKETADISQQLGTVYLQSGKLSKTYTYALEAYNIYENLNDKAGIAHCLNLLGIYYKGMHQYHLALEYLQKGLNIGEELSNISIISFMLDDIGNLYAEMGDTLKAIQAYDKAMQFHQTNEPNFKIGKFELNLGDLYLQHGGFAKAKVHIDKGYQIAKKINSHKLYRDYYKIISRYYTKSGDYPNAVSAYQKLQHYQDSIASDRLSNKIEELDSRHTIDIKNQENQVLREKNQTQQLKITRQYIIGVSTSLVLFSVIFLLVYRYRNNLKDNELLHLKNSLAGQHQEELIEAMKRLKESEDKLRTANKTKDKMFSLIAHDLRGAIGNISNGLRMMLRDKNLNLSEEEKSEFLESLFHSAGSSFELLENLLSWAGNQSSVMSAKPQMVDVNSIIISNISLLADLAKVKSIRLFASSNPTAEVYVDWNMVNTVLRNLISNAIKFVHKGGNIEIKSELGDYFVKISVIDDGIGMKPDQIENIYDGKTTDGTAHEKGTGLGLTLCRDFLRKNHGKLMVESEIDRGSTFSFTIPRRAMNDEEFLELMQKESFFSLVI